ncbi:hypothetical protein D3C73_1671110 [compost metagenome]
MIESVYVILMTLYVLYGRRGRGLKQQDITPINKHKETDYQQGYAECGLDHAISTDLDPQ